MARKLGPKKFAENFLTPLNAQREGAEPGPDVFNTPIAMAADPLGLLPEIDPKGPVKIKTKGDLSNKSYKGNQGSQDS